MLISSKPVESLSIPESINQCRFYNADFYSARTIVSLLIEY